MYRSVFGAAGRWAPVVLVCALAAGARAEEEPKSLQELQRVVEEMRRQHEQELAELYKQLNEVRAAGERSGLEAEVDQYLDETAGEEEKPFVARGLGLQALNPEISVVGDFFTNYISREGEPGQLDFFFRVLDIHIESYLDPYSRLKAAIEIHTDGAELGEAYYTRFGLLPHVNATAGKFRQQFGVVNRWHKHGLDQADFPLPLRSIFGEGGLNQIGFSFDWGLPEWGGATQTLILEITGGTNGRLFGGNPRHLPSFLLRYKYYRDITASTYLDFGLTGLVGWNEEWSVTSGGTTSTVRDRLVTAVFGADLTLLWEPTDRMRYANLVWRSEAYVLRRELLAPDGSGSDTLVAWGVYTYVQRKVSRTVEIGIRVDYYRPDTKAYADMGLVPLAVTAGSPYRWRVGPYLTWWQSPWVRVRLEGGYTDGNGTGPSELVFGLQLTFAAGPHKHERY
jgi:hypothetical protein